MPEPWTVLVPFIADTGLRIGEVAGLRWRDVGTWNGTVSVREVLVEVRGEALSKNSNCSLVALAYCFCSARSQSKTFFVATSAA
jgi:hypothetical protein